MKKDMILHTIAKQLVRNWRTRVLSVAHSSSLTNALTQGRNLCADEITARPSRDYVSLPTTLRLVVTLLLMMVLGVNSAWGQGYSGVYYIASEIDSYGNENNHYSGGTAATHCYLIPAEYSSASELAYYTSDISKPYLTTLKTNQDLNSIWILKKTGEGNYYYIIHALTGKYLVYAVPTANQNGDKTRRVVHLEANPDLTDDNTKFEITLCDDSYYHFSPYALKDLPNGSNKFLNVCTQNRNITYGQNSGKQYSDGLIGVYGDPDKDNKVAYLSRWHLEDASSSTHLTPVISDLDEETNTFTITSPAAAFSSFRYTTDGSTTPTASEGTPNDGSSIYPTAIWQVQAVGVFDGFVTPVAGPKTITPSIPITPTITYDNTTAEVTISSTNGSTIYYTASTSGTEPSAPTSSSYDGTGPSPVTISGVTTPTIYKAIATKSGFEDSEVATQSIEKLANPTVTFVDATQKVTITTNSVVEGAKSVYTINGNNPTPSSEEYSEAISLTGTTTVKAMTVKDGYINSDVVPLTVTKLASSPSISKSGSTVTLSYTGDGTEIIHYTTDGTTPTLESASYSTALTLDGNQKYTIKAIATKTGSLHSDVAEEVVDNRSSISAPTIAYTDNTVTITASDYGDEIYYTIDGTTPTTSTATHFTSSGTFDLVNGYSYTIKAIASNGVISSPEATETIDLTIAGYAGIYYIQNNANSGDFYMYPVGGESALVKTAKKTDLDAIWKIEIVGDYYRIIHYKDGKYLVAANVVDGAMPDTETVSLVATDSPGENALFEITRLSGNESDILQQIILIRPKAAANANGHIYLNTRDGNDGTHTIGLWDNTGSSEWKLVTVPAKPTFTVNDIKVTISSDLGNVYYTIDGTTPTSSSTSGKNVTLAYGPSYTVKAISIYHDNISGADWTSEIAISNPIQVNLLPPIITRSGNNVTITNSQASGVTFRYTFSDDGTDPADPVPGGAGTNYASALPLTANARSVFKAIAYNTVDATTYTSGVVTFIVDLRSATTISSLADITSATGSYILSSGFSATGTPEEGGVEIGTSSNPFRGTIDGNLVEFELSSPLFDYVQDATIKNVIISKATISTSGNAGAIANNALGATRIYNCGILATGSTVEKDENGYDHISSCSSTISGSGYVGGIVGLLDGSSRVINCFSYANVNGGSYAGGIVGWNNVATTSANQKTMVMNCMFYGEVSGTSRAPIYNGEIITNRSDESGVGNFNYFRQEATYVRNLNTTIDKYNCALAAETRFLQRFEFFRPLLNSNRALAAWWATGDRDNKNEMMKWVMEPSQIGTSTPYPILKAPDKYPSVVNIDAPNAEDFDNTDKKLPRNKGRKFGTFTIDIQNGSGGPTGADVTTTRVTPNITDKDPEHFNFNYYKVQLPYYNDVGTKNYTGNKVVTGWKIVSMSKSAGSFTTGSDASATVDGNGDLTLTTPYNFADRNCTAKDIYSSTNKRVFSQGAYFDVPEGVTSITIEPYWAECVYVADAYPDVVYNQNMSKSANVTTVGGGQRYTNNTAYNINGSSQKVYTTMGNAVTALNPSSTSTVYDNAIVLVGNVHNIGITSQAYNKPYTIMSIDLDKDNEPDYSYILRFNDRVRVHPVRIDFLNVIGLGMAQKSSGGTGTYNFGIMQPLGWFECTNTALFRVTQFEYDKKGTTDNPRVNSPMILQGGVIEQWVTVGGAEETHQEGKTVSYYHVGGNVWFKEFHIGVHQDKNLKTDKNPNPDQFVSPHPPISVTGGDFDEFYLTGLYNTPNNTYDDNAECYINGGRFGKVAGTGMQGIGVAGKDPQTDDTGNIIWQIDNADIDEFYAGGINAAHIAEGNIYTVITNSRVDQFCGGPKFGNMNSDKIVVTNATNCTFRTFFGAGYGGNSYNRRYPSNKNNVINMTNPTWNSWVSSEYTKKYDSNYGGVETRIDYQFIPMSGNEKNVARLFVDYVSFSLATTHDVTSKLTDCTITTSPLGRLSISDDYKCLGSFYGGGSLGMVNGPVKSTLTNCTVDGNVFGGGYSATLPTVKVMNPAFQTEPKYDENLGAYLEAELPSTETYTWQHRDEVNTTGTAINTTKHILYTTEDLTSLGKVTGNVTLTIDGNTTLTDGKVMSVAKSVYGGGEESNVAGNTQVNITGGTITQNVFGGGKGEADNFTCDKAMVGNSDEGQCADPGSDDNKNKGTIVSISNGTVNGNVYGGGEVGRVEWNTQVKIGIGTGDGTFAPEINGSVFGAGKGKETHGYAALVRGNSTVTIGGGAKVRKNVYGGGEQATVGRYWVKGIPTTTCTNETEPTYPDDTVLPNEMPYKTRRGGKSTVIVQGSAQIGPNDGATATAGHVFGAGKGVTPAYNNTQGDVNRSKRMVTYNSSKHTSGGAWDFIKNYSQDEIADATITKYVWEYFTTETKYFEFLQSLALVTGTDVTINGATVKGNVYGGSESGFVQDDTDVKIQGGTIGTSAATTYGNVFGGGKGLSAFAEAGKVKGNTTVAINNGAVMGNVYGGGELGDVGTIIKPADYNYAWKKTDGSTPNTLHNNTITGTNTNTGICTVTISGGTIGVDNPSVESEHGNVFGAGKGEATTFWCEKAIAYGTVVSISAGTVKGNVYGGGQIGRVEDDTKVTIAGESEGTRADIKGSVFGAGAGLSTHGYSALVRGDTKVTVEGYAQVAKSVYGGGETASVGRYGLNVQKMPNILVGGGKCELKVQGNAAIGENVFGACKGVTPAYNNTQGDVNRSKRMVTYDPDRAVNPHVEGTVGSFWNFYENDHRFVWEYFTTQEAYSTYLETLALATHPEVTIDGSATVGKSVFGGGEMGLTKGSVIVTIQGGTIEEDVYGGGALSDTNTTELVADNYPTTAPTLNTDGSIKTKEVSPTTTVNLLGGLIKGDAYGGGLGRLASGNLGAVEAKVYGDVLVELNNNNNGNTADGTKAGCVVSRIFGANNKNGSPKGNITVHVFGTQHMGAATIGTKLKNANADLEKGSQTDEQYLTVLKGVLADMITKAGILHISVTTYQGIHDNPSSTADDLKTAIKDINDKINAKTADENTSADDIDALYARIYDVKAVYGGGNEAAYIPTTAYHPTSASTGSKTQVIIEGCDETSIETVYGGGNAASVPETNVDVRSAHEIQAVFGGGNGKDNTSYGANPGADVGTLDQGTTTYGTGNANTLLEGGYIHEAYGASNSKGKIMGNVSINTSPAGSCNLKYDKLVGAGKNADVDHDVIMVLGCNPTTKNPLIFGGADNANVNGNVELTITSGTFGQVFGGNNLGGIIKGHIKVNIEETECTPIRIDELYLGGNQAAYSSYGYYKDGEIYRPRTAAMAAITDPNAAGYHAAEEGNHSAPYAQPELNVISCTYIGKVFGGGYGERAILYGNPTVNINMIPGRHAVEGALGEIVDVFGGGNQAKVEGNTTVNIGTAQTVGMVTAPTYLAETAYTHNTTTGLYEVAVKGANIFGNVYGGGNQADVTGNTFVNICTEDYSNTTGFKGISIDNANDHGGSVYGGGCSADVLGNTNVTMSGGYVFNGIFGGGYAGSVGTFDQRDKTLTTDNFDHSTHSSVCLGKPTHCVVGTGKCTVVVDGGQIGPVKVATEGMTGANGPVVEGWVWGGGQGLIEDPEVEHDTHFKSYVGSTDVTIGGTAFILESIIGGGEFGRVLGDTKVTIEGHCQIGVGAGKAENGKPVRYAEADFIDPSNSTPEQINAKAAIMPECSHFPYGNSSGEYLPYDPYYGLDKYSSYITSHTDLGPASTSNPSDGKTWIGCVFGGGSGYMPYEKAGNTVGYDWVRSAGLVEGNSTVEITGGHILTNVYGGNEVTDVKGKSTVKMSGGTIGVPRTLQQIQEHPVACNLFGAGKGDERAHFSQYTNVGSVEVEVSGGIIYGSVFGGSEDGHVLGNVLVTIKDGVTGTGENPTTTSPIIGTWGTSYMDGNVFGGGRGFSGTSLTNGNVSGNVTMNIQGGIMLGSVYGGGRLGSVEGDVDISISGGTIGNESEYVYPTAAQKASDGALRNTSYDATTNRLTHTKGGNVFAGGMGRRTTLNGAAITSIDWKQLGNVKSTTLAISGGTIRGNVYGGGELGAVTGSHTSTNPTAVATEITITGGTIGSEIPDETGGGTGKRYYFGSVYGGGMGEIYKNASNNDTFGGGDVANNTKVSVGQAQGKTTWVKASVFGGGELAQVAGSTYVTVSGGEIGKNETRDDGYVMFGGATMGNVFGGGKGSEQFVEAGLVKTNTNVSITGGSVYHNVYGGGALGSVGTFSLATAENKGSYYVDKVGTPVSWTEGTGTTNVNVTGGTIGITGWDNGMVDGASRGAEGDPDAVGSLVDQLAWVKTSNVTIGTSNGANNDLLIHGSVYGGGENGHNSGNAVVTVHSGTIGTNASATFDNGNVYGAGCGTDKYTGTDSKWHYNPLAGIVRGTTTVTVDGGHVLGNVYGAGSMASVGTVTSKTAHKDTQNGTVYTEGTDVNEKIYGFGLSWPYEFTYEGTTGLTTVNIKDNAKIDNYVFGAAKGAVDVNENDITNQRYVEALFANVRETQVNIGETGSPTVRSVYGGGEDGHVNGNATVTIDGGTIEHSVFGGGKGDSKYQTTLWKNDNNNPGQDKDAPEMVYSWTAGKVYGNTTVTMNAGSVGYNIYGGGNLASVGKGNYSGGSDDYSEAGYGELPRKVNNAEGPLWTTNPTAGTDAWHFANSGIAYVYINGGTVGTDTGYDKDGIPYGNVFGGSRGKAAASGRLSPRYRYNPDFFLGYVNKSIVTIGNSSGTPTINGSVYGGGQDGHIRNSAQVIVKKGTIGIANDTNIERGNVFGAGSGIGKYDSDGNGSEDACNYSSGSVTCTTQVDIEGGTIYRNVYGGGALASVGPPFTTVQKINDIAYDEVKTVKSGNSKASVSYSQVNIKGGAVTGSVYGASRGPSDALITNAFTVNNVNTYNDKQFATVIWADVNVTGAANITGSVYGGGEKGIVKHATEVNIGTTGTGGVAYTGTISEDVFGGGKEAIVGGNVTVNMNSGTVNKSVYGGGALAHTNTNNATTNTGNNKPDTGAKVTGVAETIAITGETNNPKTEVNLLGGLIKGDAYGGGLGRKESGTSGNPGYIAPIPATVFGDINVYLGGNATEASASATAFNITNYTGAHSNVVKSGRVFGCNNLKGSPQGDVTVTVWKTVSLDAQGAVKEKPTKDTNIYELAAVYGGGNLADFTATGKKANVIIKTCDVSVQEVYGGGNAADVPQTDVLINGAHEIKSVFGGGNGKDPYTLDGGDNWEDNQGADVNGNATTLLKGGYIHEAYGGSNSKGVISGDVTIDKGSGGACTLIVNDIYGAGKDADVEGDLILIMGCSESRTENVYGCSKNANVKGNVELTITSGEYGKVFGGNNESGAIFGHIIVNVEEVGCSPIIIDELYGCGRDAAYSTFGYWKDPNEDVPEGGKPTYIARTSLTDHVSDLVTFDGKPHTVPPYDDPVVNIISATRIGKVFGGGLGSGAIVYGNPKVNINMIKGAWAGQEYTAPDNSKFTPPNNLGTIGAGYSTVEGGVFGGGNEAAVYGNTTVNIGTENYVYVVDLYKESGSVANYYTYNEGVYTATSSDATAQEGVYYYKRETVEGANVTGNVYGGGNLADIGKTHLGTENGKTIDVIDLPGNTFVNIGANMQPELVNDQPTGAYTYTPVAVGTSGVNIAGNVFGGGKGEAATSGDGAFRCGKAMVTGGTNVHIGNGTVGTLDANNKLVEGTGNVYGGGQIGRVETNGVVMIGLPVGTGETSAPMIRGNVFGGGKGVKTHGYAALLRGNTFVTVQTDAKVGRSVYGGGEIASVGKYNVADAAYHALHPEVEDGMPYSLGNENSGYCNVIVRGNAEIGPDNMKMYYEDGSAPDDEGHVFGAGKGILPYEDVDIDGGEKPGRMTPGNTMEYYTQNDYHPTGTETYEEAYLRFIESQALATHTEVLVGGNSFVKGSVYGGSLSGHVQHDTHVTITGDCQIGAGFKDGQSLAKYTNWPTDIQDLGTSWEECARWEFDANDDAPYDPYAEHLYEGKYYYDAQHTKYANGGSKIAKNGQTYYGNVFGGGSGVVPYEPGKWHREAGTVGGNTVVDITGGHILTSVYGGNECTDVGTYVRGAVSRELVENTGKCTVNMIGGTVGVPRTKAAIEAHPMISCVYGGGKGDPRVNFNKWTNVGETEVNISGTARIYGSVFGGGEDGHVLVDAETNIGGTVTIANDTHSPYSYSNVIIGSQGRSGADGNVFGGGRGFSEEALTAGVVCGNVTLNIHNGKMLGTVYGGGRLASVGTHLADAGTTLYGKLISEGYNQVIGSTTDVAATGATHGIININIDGGTIGATDAQTGKLLTSEHSIGDVFGGCKGSGNNKHFGLAKKTIITMEGGTVNGNVYGGGELGYVGEATLNSSNVYVWNEETAGGGLCTVGISGGTVKGHVFGAGKGLADDFDCEKALVRATSVTISGTGTEVSGNVYGGGEVGRVDQNTVVAIGNSASDGAGSATGTDAVISGNVFGAGAGVETHGYSALVRGNAAVTIQGNANVGHNVYGGGMIASVGQYGLDSNFMPETLKGGGDCRVTVKGYAVIGSSGEGHVFGAGKGVNPFDASHNYIDYITDSTDKATKPKRMTKKPDPDKMPALWDPVGDGSKYIWEYYTSQDNYFKFLQTLALATDSYATIDGNATVKGNVYGGSESGFVQRETDVNIQGSSKILTVTDNNTTTDGNVFGGGRGVSGFDLAGRVRGNAKTTISGSSAVNGNVYGGGELGFVGKFSVSANGRNYDWQTITNQSNQEEETGTCTVIINSATAEVKGDVFGAGKGEAITFKCEPAMTRTTSVSISNGTVGGNVYGGGEVGRVDENTVVTIGADTGDSAPHITGSVFGAGAGLGTHGYSALVRGNTYVTVQNHATVGHSVYGGGEIASVGKYGLDDQKMPSVLLGGGYCYVKVKGDATISGDVFGAGQGITPNFDKDNADRAKRPRRMTMYSSTDFPDAAKISAETGTASGTTTAGTTWEYYEPGSPYIWEYFREESGYLTYLETLALATHPEVTIEGNATIGNDVYGGGERGITKGSVIVNINGGTIARDVYGGGALANTNTTSTVGEEDHDSGVITTTTVAPTTTVNLHGGTIGHDVYGGGLGQKYKAAVAAQPAVEGHGEVGDEDYVAAQPAIAAQPEMPAIAALVYGDVLVKLNETPTVTNNVASFPDNCVVKGVIHGANNYNGSPQGDVTVHIYKTMARDEINKKSPDKDGSSYDLKAVYGGGNEAAYDPIEPNSRKAHVIIEGCGDTSIETVYGGGNAAAAPATHVEVNSCYEIGTVFAGGNGKDAMDDGSENPGADVGLIALKPGGTAYANDPTKQAYGTGIALAEIHGGFVHSAFGGSNTKGNVRESATVDLSEPEVVTCPLGIDEAYGAGNEAAQDGTSNINLGCLSYLREIYGGAKNADVNNDIVLNIQSGRFHRVFGGNNIGGKIDGSITVNIEETGCHPIVIGQLFGGGNQAGYSVYGYKEVNGKWVPRESATDSGEGPTTPYRDPLVNVRSFTSIGEIYGGGFGNSAVIVGNPTVDINVCDGNSAAVDITGDWKDQEGNVVDANVKVSANTSQWIRIKVAEGEYNTVWQPEHKSGDIGTIGNVFGGGNAAPVHGNTNVYIGTKNSVVFETPKKKPDTTNGGTSEVDTTDEDRTHIVKGANITGNVYGGGNAADVTGDTNVVIGKEKN